MFRDAQGEFQNRMLEKDFHPSEWGPEWIKTLEEVERDVDFNGMAPVVQRTLQEDFENFAGSSLIEISGSALKENLRRGKQNDQRDIEFLNSMGRFDESSQLIKDSKVWSQDETDDFIRGNNQEALAYEIETSRETDPDHMELVKKNQWGQTKLQQAQEMQKSKGVQSKKQAMALEEITVAVQAQRMSEDQMITSMAGNRWIDGQVGAIYLKNYRNSKPLQDGEIFALDDKIDALWEHRSDPDKYKAEWSKLRSEIATYGDRGGIGGAKAGLYNVRPSLHTQEKLDEAANGGRAAELRSLEMAARELVKKYSSGLAEVSFIRGKKEDADGQEEESLNAILKNEYERHAIILREKLQKLVNTFIQQPGEKKTLVEVQTFIKATINEENFETMRREKGLKLGKFNSAQGTLLPGIIPGSKEAKIAEDWLKKK
tara:strand:- start:992 stop:2281 length:1290 start_codon:yes stop_codon:yes gene_type:complete